MTQVKMLGPEAKIVSFGAGLKEVSWRKGCIPEEGASLITTSQAEAYAKARVREALEKAASICEDAYEQSSAKYAVSRNPYFEGGCGAAEFIEQKILALIPKEAT